MNQQLDGGGDLTDEQVRLAVGELVEASVADELKADFLCALGRKGETVGEISAFARELRDRSVVPPIDAETRAGTILDVCGTGGDRLNTFNISTTVALICSAAGVAVAKHGNRAITSQAGSADVLEALGLKIELSPEAAARSLRERQFAFFSRRIITRPSGTSAPRASCAPNAASAPFSTFSVRCLIPRGRMRNWWAFPIPPCARRWRRSCKPWVCGAPWW